MQQLEMKIENARCKMQEHSAKIEQVCEANFIRVLEAFRAEHISSVHFSSTTGYGYNDAGRDKLESLFARIFGCESALLRQQIVSGSHAITLALLGNLLPGDELLYVGMPYDTMQTVIGLKDAGPCSMREQGIECRILDYDFSAPNPNAVLDAIRPNTKIVAMQRSRGYSLRPSMSVEEIATISALVKEKYPDVITFVDNCYGEFVEIDEPTHHGIDLMAGSLIKNPGAGIAPGGGYVCGRAELVDRAAMRLTIPGAGRELGSSLIDNRLFYQALYLAPQIVAEALLGAIFTASLMSQLGFNTSPLADENRYDIIQLIQLQTPDRLCAFTQGIQRYSPIDSFVRPEPWPMPGYDNDIIMASGGFIAGSSIELSADAPLRDPYTVFQQGGLNRWQTIYAVSNTVRDMVREGLI